MYLKSTTMQGPNFNMVFKNFQAPMSYLDPKGYRKGDIESLKSQWQGLYDCGHVTQGPPLASVEIRTRSIQIQRTNRIFLASSEGLFQANDI